MVGGHEQRNANWSQSRAAYNVAFGIRSRSDLQALISFFMARKGRAYAFRYKDWGDFEATNQLTEAVTGSDTQFQLAKQYGDGAATYTRIIKKPVHNETVDGALRTVSVAVGGVTQASGWSVDTTTGIITFDTAPSGAVTASFTFDTPCRFDSDRMDVRWEMYANGGVDQVTLVEVRL
jgi:uncharacterized protein (TIGR02217 family)